MLSGSLRDDCRIAATLFPRNVPPWLSHRNAQTRNIHFRPLKVLAICYSGRPSRYTSDPMDIRPTIPDSCLLMNQCSEAVLGLSVDSSFRGFRIMHCVQTPVVGWSVSSDAGAGNDTFSVCFLKQGSLWTCSYALPGLCLLIDQDSRSKTWNKGPCKGLVLLLPYLFPFSPLSLKASRHQLAQINTVDTSVCPTHTQTNHTSHRPADRSLDGPA